LGHPYNKENSEKNCLSAFVGTNNQFQKYVLRRNRVLQIKYKEKISEILVFMKHVCIEMKLKELKLLAIRTR
jgi:hypothetical protein